MLQHALVQPVGAQTESFQFGVDLLWQSGAVAFNGQKGQAVDLARDRLYAILGFTIPTIILDTANFLYESFEMFSDCPLKVDRRVALLY